MPPESQIIQMNCSDISREVAGELSEWEAEKGERTNSYEYMLDKRLLD